MKQISPSTGDSTFINIDLLHHIVQFHGQLHEVIKKPLCLCTPIRPYDSCIGIVNVVKTTKDYFLVLTKHYFINE